MSQTQQYIAKPRSRKQIREYANKLRDILKIPLDKPFPVLKFVELVLPKLDEEFVFEVREVSQMPDKYGETIPKDNTIIIRQDVYDGANCGNHRDLFTIAHELGHYIYHSDETVSLARLSKDRIVKKYEDPEWQANTFAGELLCPSNMARNMMIQDIVDTYNVSFKVAEIQHNK